MLLVLGKMKKTMNLRQIQMRPPIRPKLISIKIVGSKEFKF